jgi:hypothetical protein
MPSLTVLLPTLNCRHLLPAHFDSMAPWLHLASEIIVVDSHSTDGTLEYLRERLAGYPASFHLRPRGLYQCWNDGIQQATQPWIYLSTIGDTIHQDLLVHLINLGETTGSDIVLSTPTVIADNQQPDPLAYWPVQDILKLIPPGSACTFTPELALFIALRYVPNNTLLGSSASNLYRTTHLQKHPFPTEYGTSGDGAWGLMPHVFDTRFTCTSRRGSTLLVHPKAYAPTAYHVDGLGQKLRELGLQTYRDHAHRPELARLQPLALQKMQSDWEFHYRELKKLRQQRHPWFIYPSVWAARQASKRASLCFRNALRDNQELIRSRHLTLISS